MNHPFDTSRRDVAAFACKGSGSNDELRLRQLLSGHDTLFIPFDKRAKRRSFFQLVRWIHQNRPLLLAMEGTGLAGGIACIISRLLWQQRYLVSSGDAVGPFVGGILPLLGPVFGLYERLLCRWSAGFIGWTPYLAGRALTFKSPRAMTAPGWCEQTPSPNSRSNIRLKLGIPQDAVVFGLVGSLQWNHRYQYCYGQELIQAVRRTSRQNLYVLVVGDGSGLARLREQAGDRLGKTILLPGSVPADTVVEYLAAMDVGSLPQSVDRVGSFRYTTKLSEYLAAELPIATGQIPLAYDLDSGWIWRLTGNTPWSDQYIAALSTLMQSVTADEIAAHKTATGHAALYFEKDRQVKMVTAFVSDLLTSPAVLSRSSTAGKAPASSADSNQPLDRHSQLA